MNRRSFLATSAVAAALPALGKSAKRPNILWIYCDDHSHNAISAYGESHITRIAKTPNIDRIAQKGTVFQNSFVTNSICGPCRAVILTGKHSHINGFKANGNRFNGDQQTFPKLLQKAGYETVVIGKWHLKSEPQGFNNWEILPGQGHYYNPDFITEKGTHQETGYVTDLITDKGLDWIKNERDPDKPFMMMLQHKAPHREWSPPANKLSLYDDVDFPEPPTLFDDYEGRGSPAHTQDMMIKSSMDLTDLKLHDSTPPNDDPESRECKRWKEIYMRTNPGQRNAWDAAYQPKNKAFREANPDGRDLIRWKYQRYVKDYMRCISSVDDNVGRVLDFLEESGLAENTVVMYSSDQSFYLGEHGWFDKRFMYEESVRTPLLGYWPGQTPAGSNSEAMVQNLDMAQTFLDIAGVPEPGDMQGQSLVPLLKGESPKKWRTSIYYQYHQIAKSIHHVQPHYGVRTDRYKLIHFNDVDEWELYDLEKDPHELKSEYANPEYAKTVRKMKAELKRLRREYRVEA
ncbi:sulfatase/phosphatase domain-containing protein [Pontiella sulfatireligans]|uniref:Arylsulfatase n=1 Tax=Pontiella sulfatireligans TaxID=2750658 RepID=A0A6C2UNU2_9BACT|nr:sulfatase/phosphatase domain-containing protein [Pontiella sulfatireligans]SPS74476.1 sulfatase S1_11 [Kiritimatiellales bacterium]VGO21925.1 Arylsulfatase [Pontiella sulfatireligans]